jgi:hypothetical protein
MPECDHCGATFDGDDAYLDHLKSAHSDELGAIERRRLADRSASGDGLPMGPIAIGGVLLITAGVLVYIIMFTGSGGQNGPTEVGLEKHHKHGMINVTIDGRQIDFSKRKYQLQDDAFHFEGGVGHRWHVHAKGVTLAYAMSTLGIGVNETAVTIDGTTYRDDTPGQSVTVTEKDHGAIDPESYILKDGDHIRIVVTVE